jgi:hypothetical protein
MTKIASIVLVFGILVLVGVLFTSNSNNTVKVPDRMGGILNIGHGVYYFDHQGEKFGIEIAKFKATHEYKIISVTMELGYSGNPSGYYVITEEP